MNQVLAGFLLAIQFLTRIPIPVEVPWNQQSSRWALRFYPVVGLIIGVAPALLISFIIPHISLPIATLLIISLWVWMTGGLHLDGVMDVADAIGSNAPLEKKWEIMRDPHVGSFGHLALYFLLAWKTVLIYSLLKIDVPIFNFLLIPAFARYGAALFITLLPTAKQQGLAFEWKKNITMLDCIFAAVPLVIIVLFVPQALYMLIGYCLYFGAAAVWIQKTFKGTNGDLLGSTIEGGELWGLIITWIYISYVMV
ncbi:adenosylcobinamide-GDP ribazoletransferase [Metabacillus malikii]|uniref:Adenosylcobinamide-GDP ribazoletransferase n=1 Tax=Metabacillus malikii TaxID=1504265 RepID=A0ABT9ZCK6_9BACI|nr:adenosylcobinamide-GDP ribazoletransferase [Metabacillus malikii]MDQ0228995.1 adenosylcobinamide-GDP ribazoletransferase [Metabacillus malikii]